MLTLRGFANTDAALVQKASADPLIPLITTVPTTPDVVGALAFIDRQRRRMLDGAGYSFAIADTETDEAIGQIGLWPLGNGRASLGYWVLDRHRRRGIAHKAIALVIEWAKTLTDLHRLELYVEPWNAGSWRAADARDSSGKASCAGGRTSAATGGTCSCTRFCSRPDRATRAHLAWSQVKDGLASARSDVEPVV